LLIYLDSKFRDRRLHPCHKAAPRNRFRFHQETVDIYAHLFKSIPYFSDQEASKERIPWAEDAPPPLAQRVRDTPEGHLEVPLHPAAQKFWGNAAIYKSGDQCPSA
jgi:hypothetical protein